MNFATRTEAAATAIPGSVAWVQTMAFAAAGDEGGARYKRVAAQPAHAGKFQSADGAWWEIAESALSVRAFGAKGDGVANDHGALQAALSAANTLGGGIVMLPRGRYRVPAGSNTLFMWSGTTVRGEGIGRSVLVWEHAATASRRDFLRTSGSIQNVAFEDFEIRGDWDTYFGSTRSQMVELSVTKSFRATRCRFAGSPFMSLIVSDCDGVSVTECEFENGYADGCRIINSQNVLVTNNRFRNICDDAIAIHTADTSGDPSKSTIIVGDNVITDSQGIAVLGGRAISVTGNVLVRTQTRAIMVGGAGNPEGNTSNLAISITGNTLLDVFDGYYFSNVNGSSKEWIAVNVTPTELDANGARIGFNNPATGTIASPFPYFYQNDTDLPAKYSPGGYGITITGNTCLRTLQPTAAYSDYGFGPRMNRNGYADPQVTQGMIGGTQIKVKANARFLTISGNTLSGGTEGIGLHGSSTDAWPSFSGVDLVGNNISNFTDWGIRFTGGGSVNVIGGTIDGDPFHVHSNRLASGKWINAFSTDSKPAAFRPDGEWARFNILGPTLRNLFTTYFSLGDTPISFESLTCCCNPASVGWHADNVGIAAIPYAGPDVRFHIEDGDPFSTTYGKALNVCQVSSTTLPTSGKYVRGHFVRNRTAGISSGKVLFGWSRLTTGTAHVAGVDWSPVYGTTS